MNDALETGGSFSRRINLPPALVQRLLRYLSTRNILLGLTGVLFLIAWNRGISLLYGMASLLLGVLVVSYLAPYISLRKVSARHRHPAEVQAGEPFALTLLLQNAGRGSRYMLAIEDLVPCGAEGAETVFGYVPHLKRMAEIEMRVTAAWRGVHRLGPIHLQSSYPLGVHRVSRPVPDSTSTLTVFPATFAIGALPLEGHGREDVAGKSSRRMGSFHDLHSLREYRHGDSVRHIHWPSSARRGELLVKQFEAIDATEVLIVLDQDPRGNVGKGRHTTFEYSVTIAASLARYALEQGFRVGLSGQGQEPLRIPPSRNRGQLQAILQQLAQVAVEGTQPYPLVVEQCLAQSRAAGLLVLFTTTGNVSAVMERVAAGRGMWRLLLVEFEVESFRFPERRYPAGSRGETGDGLHYRIGRHDSLPEIFNL